MPGVNLVVLINLLEEIDDNLYLVWEGLQNYDLIPIIERQRGKLANLINSIRIICPEAPPKQLAPQHRLHSN
jgi:hypothetical protein